MHSGAIFFESEMKELVEIPGLGLTGLEQDKTPFVRCSPLAPEAWRKAPQAPVLDGVWGKTALARMFGIPAITRISGRLLRAGLPPSQSSQVIGK